MDATALSEKLGVPVWLIERSAAARARAAGSTEDQIYAAWSGEGDAPEGSTPPSPAPEAAQEPAPQPAVAAPDASGLSGDELLTAVAEARGMPASLIKRSAQARASAAGMSLDDVLLEWAAEEGLTASPAPPSAAPVSEPTAAPTPEPAPEPVESVDVGIAGDELLAAVAEARGLPKDLIERSARARAETAGYTLESVLYEWAEEEGVIETAPPAVPVAKEEQPAAAPPAPQPASAPPAKVAAGLTGAALLSAVAEARGMPESLVQRSASARAKKTGASIDEVLAEWAREEGLTPEASAAEPVSAAATPAATALTGPALLAALAEKRGMPASLVERSAKAKAKKTDSTVDAVLTEWAREEGLITDAAPPAPPAETAPAPAAATGALEGAALLAAVAEKRGMPASLVERSAKAKAKKTDTTIAAVLTEWAREEGLITDAAPPAPPAEAAPAPTPTADAAATEAVEPAAPPAAGAGAEPTEAAAPAGSRRLRPLALGAIAAVGVALLLSIVMAVVDLPASGADAPWYAAGLEPFIAVVVLPVTVLVAVVGLALTAWSPRVKPSIRRFALMALVFVVIALALLTGIGALLA